MPLDSKHRQEAWYPLSDEGVELQVWASKSPLSLHEIKLPFLVPTLVTWLRTNFWELIIKDQAGPSFSRGLQMPRELQLRVQRLPSKRPELVMLSRWFGFFLNSFGDSIFQIFNREHILLLQPGQINKGHWNESSSFFFSSKTILSKQISRLLSIHGEIQGPPEVPGYP